MEWILFLVLLWSENFMDLDIPDRKVHGANMRPIWGRQDPGGPHVGPMNFAIWDVNNNGKCVNQLLLMLAADA